MRVKWLRFLFYFALEGDEYQFNSPLTTGNEVHENKIYEAIKISVSPDAGA